jgi:hypothetical protein
MRSLKSILTNRVCRLADSVQYDEETKEEYFAMPLTEKMTVDELFRKFGSCYSPAVQ